MNKFTSTILSLLFLLNCSFFQKEKEDDANRNLLIGLAIANANSSAGLLTCSNSFAAIACVPDSLTSSSTSTKSFGKTVTTNDSKYTNLPNIYKPIRDSLKANKDIMASIGSLIANLRTVSVSSTALTGTTTIDSRPAKYKYISSTKRSGGKHLEIWWNGASAPYNSLKMLEIDFIDGGDTGTVEGQVWLRGANSNSTLYKAYIKFNYNGTTKVRTSSVVVNGYYDSSNSTTENTHFFVSEGAGIAKLDGGFTVTNHSSGLTGVSASNRVYLYSAAGSTTRSAAKIAFPLSTNSNTNVFDNGNVANIAEVWTDWLLFSQQSQGNLSNLSTLCSTSLTAPSTAHPITSEGSESSALKTCFDKILASGSNSTINSIYYIAAARNPAYYSYPGTSNSTSILESIETSPDISWATVEAALRTTVRTTSDTDYSANFSASSITSINLGTGTGLTVNEQWGDGATGVNSTNGSSDNTAGF